MSSTNRRRQPGNLDPQAIAIWVVIVIAWVAIGAIYAGAHAGHRLAGTATAVPANPFEVVFGVFSGEIAWPPQATMVVVALLLLVVGIGVAVAVPLLRWRSRRRSRVDAAAAHMGRGRDMEAQSKKALKRQAQRLGVTDEAGPGLPLGVTVADAQPMYSSWEDMVVLIAGPRTQKTTSFAIPRLLEAPGAAVVTSNKRDVVDATRGPRSAVGTCWIFDVQGIAGERPAWWWNPLSYVTDEVKAAKLAEHFAAAQTGAAPGKDTHFEQNGEDLLGGLFLAAAIGGYPITQVYTWLTQPGNEEPADIVRGGGYPLTADQLTGIATTPDRERGSIYSTARRMAACLTYRHVAEWVIEPGPGSAPRPHFNPRDFVRSRDTLYSLSKEGKGSAGPLVMALTAAVTEAGEELAIESSGGRVPTPLLGVLDEAANVCRWRELPNLYSHYGSRGILLDTILQSWSQGVEVWGQDGMKKLWSAANVRVYGGGVNDARFLEELTQTVGDYDRETASVSTGARQRNVSRQLQRERVLDVADLASMPKGRALLMASGSPPTLIRTRPWMTGPHAAAVRESIRANDPQAEQTIRDAETVGPVSTEQPA